MPVTGSRPFSHVVGFYATDRFLVGRIADFVREGLNSAEHVLVIATSAHWTSVAEQLDDRGVPHGRAAERGELVVADAEEVLEHITIDGKVSVERFRQTLEPLIKTPRRLRVYGEVVALLAARGDIEAAAAIEALGQEVAGTRDIQIMCSYCVDGPSPLSEADAARVAALHDGSFREPGSAPSAQLHAVRFYRDETELSAMVASFLADGLAAREPLLVIATPRHAGLIADQLQARGADPERLRAEGQLSMVDAEATLAAVMVDGMPHSEHFRDVIVPLVERANRYRRGGAIRAYGEMVDLLWRQGRTVAAVRLETLWNELAKTHEFSLLCGYSMGQFYKNADVNEVCGQHSHVVSARGVLEPVV